MIINSHAFFLQFPHKSLLLSPNSCLLTALSFPFRFPSSVRPLSLSLSLSLSFSLSLTHTHTASSAVVNVGLFGGVGGGSWDDKSYTTIRQIVIRSGHFIDAIQIEYDDQRFSKWGDMHGGGGGGRFVIGLNYPDEYLVSVSGYYSTQGSGSNTVLQSLTFRTNIKIYGPYDSERGVYFSFPPGIGKIIGFFGRSGSYLDGIGAYNIEPFQNVRTITPFGGSGGRVWDDGIHTGVNGLIMASGSSIDSITFKYDDNGQSLWSAQHGDSEGGTKYLVTFDYPNEYLTSISGCIFQTSDFEVLCSITIQTNQKTYGPYGKEEGTYFSTSAPGNEGKIVGLFGRAGDYVDSIGAYVEP